MFAFDYMLYATLRLVGAIQTLLRLELGGRPLTSAEMDQAKSVFGASVDLGAVRVKEGGAGLLTLPGRPWTCGNIIYFPAGWPTDTPTLTHELTHVWQFQHGGPAYMRLSVWAQYFGEGYSLEPAKGKQWAELNPEQQATLVEIMSRGFSLPGMPADALSLMRSGLGAPTS